MPLYRTEAIVLLRRDIKETDKIVTFYSPDYGKFQAVAKGVRKSQSKLSGAMEPFTYNKLLLATGRNIDIVAQVQTKESFYKLRQDMSKVAYGTYMVELLDKFTEEGQRNPEIFQLLLSALYVLQNTLNPKVLARLFELQLIKRLGYSPRLDVCVSCSQLAETEPIGFSISLGGLLCARCRLKYKVRLHISKTTLKYIRLLTQLEPSEVNKIQLDDKTHQELERIVRAYIQYQLERRLKSIEFLKQINDITSIIAESQK